MKLKSWVVTTIMAISIFAICGLTIYVTTSIYNSNKEDNNSYVLRDIAEDIKPVINEIEKSSVISKPFEKDNVSIYTNFYNLDDNRDIQEKSLILFENTYMPSSGVLYGSEEEFDVLAVYQGEVLSITDSNAFGTTVEIKHDNDIVSKYSSLKDVSVKVGDVVSSGDVIGKSNENKINSSCKNMLFFELISKGKNINPEYFYGISIEELK